MTTDLNTEDLPSRYVVGIDLGTTNSAVAYVDTASAERRSRILPIPQSVALGQVESLETLPSFHYEPLPEERGGNALKLPWTSESDTYTVGTLAREAGARQPGRLVVSAKSWLCHSGVDRTAELLPWHGAEDVQKLSPVTVSSRYLSQVRAAWNHRFPDEPLERQDIVLTLPASFDEVARELTVRAAKLAGLPRVVLVEEPQAAFYAWLQKHEADWESRVSPGQKILVCDIGGGTSDLTLIRVRRGEDAPVQFHRVAVGDHLILGGDNLDLALAHHLEGRLAAGKSLTPSQWGTLVRRCRQVKETLLGPDAPERETVTIAGTGTRLIGGSLSCEVSREEVETLLVEGFLPRVSLGDRPAARRSGFQEMGLPYATDPAITRYLAQFLETHRRVGLTDEEAAASATDPARPDIVLFNGGFFESPALRERFVEVLASWFPDPTGWRPEILDHARLDLAVAEGAAYYGLVRRGLGVRIAAGLPRTYYIGVAQPDADSPPQAVCLVPAGTEEGQAIELERPAFELLLKQPVEFPLYVSSTRLVDRPGELVEIDPEELTALPPIRTVLTSRSADSEMVRVHVHARLNEIGTLELWCAEADGKRQWRLQFDVRSTTETDRQAHANIAERSGFVEQGVIDRCGELIGEVFDAGSLPPKQLIPALEEAIGTSRWNWPPSLLRELWDRLLQSQTGRRRSPAHEARWLNVLGFSLRPGYGLALDDWRVTQTWKLFQDKRVIHADVNCRIESLILWRRIGAGLTAGQQQALAEPLVKQLRPHMKTAMAGKLAKPAKQLADSKPGGKKTPASIFGTGGHETAEAWRLLGSLEHLPAATKIELGTLLVQLIEYEPAAAVRSACLWTLGRLGARVPLAGLLNAVPPAAVVGTWIERLLRLPLQDDVYPLALMLLARRTDDRYRDVSASVRNDVLHELKRLDAAEHLVTLVRDGGELETEEQGQVFGESLPSGLRIAST
jgi:molecular chaperone DnaK (HSP70)